MLMMNLGHGYYIDVDQVKMVGSLAGSSKVLPRLMELTLAQGEEKVINTCRGKKRSSMILMKDGSIFLSHRAAKTVIKNMYLAMMNHLVTAHNDISFQPIDKAFYNVMLKMTLDVYADIKAEAIKQQQRSGKIYAMPPKFQEAGREYRDELHPDFADTLDMNDLMEGIKTKFDGRIGDAFTFKGSSEPNTEGAFDKYGEKPPWEDEDDEDDDTEEEEEDDDMDDEEEEDDE